MVHAGRVVDLLVSEAVTIINARVNEPDSSTMQPGDLKLA